MKKRKLNLHSLTDLQFFLLAKCRNIVQNEKLGPVEHQECFFSSLVLSNRSLRSLHDLFPRIWIIINEDRHGCLSIIDCSSPSLSLNFETILSLSNLSGAQFTQFALGKGIMGLRFVDVLIDKMNNVKNLSYELDLYQYRVVRQWYQNKLIKLGPSLVALESDSAILTPEIIEKMNLDVFSVHSSHESDQEIWKKILNVRAKKLVLYCDFLHIPQPCFVSNLELRCMDLPYSSMLTYLNKLLEKFPNLAQLTTKFFQLFEEVDEIRKLLIKFLIEQKEINDLFKQKEIKANIILKVKLVNSIDPIEEADLFHEGIQKLKTTHPMLSKKINKLENKNLLTRYSCECYDSNLVLDVRCSRSHSSSN